MSTVHSRIGVKIGVPFSALLRGFMLLRELKIDQKRTFMDFCIESFRNRVIFRYLESYSKITKKLKFLFSYCEISLPANKSDWWHPFIALMREFTLLRVSLMWEVTVY